MIKDNFVKHNNSKIKSMSKDKDLQKISNQWLIAGYKHEYSYHFRWLGRPIIQYPQDIVAMQEIIWKVKPDIIIETGIARGGSLILSASILELIGKGEVLGIDVDIREHNKNEIKKHPLYKRISMIEGSSINKETIKKVKKMIQDKKSVMILLDSNHTHKHVLKELNAYSKFVTKGSYIIVFDTIIGELPEEFFKNRPWNRENNPKTAVEEFLKKNERFKIDKKIENKLALTAARSGYLKCLKN